MIQYKQLGGRKFEKLEYGFIFLFYVEIQC